MRRRTIEAAALLGALAAAPALAADAEDAIRSRIDAFQSAFNEGDAAAIGEFYTQDAVILPPDAPRVQGRDKIVAYWQGAIEQGAKDLDITPVEIVATDDTAYEMSTFTLNVEGQQPQDQVDVAGKYIVVWRRGEDGTWRLHRDIWNFTAQP